jgi:hypothetical protein
MSLRNGSTSGVVSPHTRQPRKENVLTQNIPLSPRYAPQLLHECVTLLVFGTRKIQKKHVQMVMSQLMTVHGFLSTFVCPTCRQ